MKLATFTAPGFDAPLGGLVEGDRVSAFENGRTVIDVLSGQYDGMAGAAVFDLNEVTLLAPVPAPPTIYAIGLNYAQHVAETGATAPSEPLVFVKVRGSVAPPGGPVVCPAVVRRLDYEGELAIVIGREGAIGGYCVADDVTARDLQRREPQWTRAKGADTFCPFGPWVTTFDEIEDVAALQLRTWVNGELRQDSLVGDMIFSCVEVVDFIAQTCTLVPGDLILTGTPSGVGMGMDPPRFLTSGDVVRIEITGLGSIEHPVT